MFRNSGTLMDMKSIQLSVIFVLLALLAVPSSVLLAALPSPQDTSSSSAAGSIHYGGMGGGSHATVTTFPFFTFAAASATEAHTEAGTPLHLRCSACLAVAAELGKCMNRSLANRPASYLISHRLEKAAGERRQSYKRGELRAVEVLDGICGDASLAAYLLRLNPKTKVRGYHLLDYGDAKAAGRQPFEEEGSFPDPEGPPASFHRPLNAIRLPVAHYYSRAEREAIGKVGFFHEPQLQCRNALEEKDDELSELVREADWLTEVEEQLCGLNWGTVVSATRRQLRDLQQQQQAAGGGDTGEEEAGPLWGGLPEPVSRACMDAAAVQASARMDQRRWFAWQYHRKAERAARRGRTSAGGGTAEGDKTTATSPAADAAAADDVKANGDAEADVEDAADL